jgi:hypothetical protein
MAGCESLFPGEFLQTGHDFVSVIENDRKTFLIGWGRAVIVVADKLAFSLGSFCDASVRLPWFVEKALPGLGSDSSASASQFYRSLESRQGCDTAVTMRRSRIGTVVELPISAPTGQFGNDDSAQFASDPSFEREPSRKVDLLN